MREQAQIWQAGMSTEGGAEVCLQVPRSPGLPRSAHCVHPRPTSSTYPRAAPSIRATENRMPRWMTATSPGATRSSPNSVVISSAPCGQQQQQQQRPRSGAAGQGRADRRQPEQRPVRALHGDSQMGGLNSGTHCLPHSQTATAALALSPNPLPFLHTIAPAAAPAACRHLRWPGSSPPWRCWLCRCGWRSPPCLSHCSRQQRHKNRPREVNMYSLGARQGSKAWETVGPSSSTTTSCSSSSTTTTSQHRGHQQHRPVPHTSQSREAHLPAPQRVKSHPQPPPCQLLRHRHRHHLAARTQTHLPAPQMVNSPRTKSTGSAGIAKGRQRSWLGVTTPASKEAVRVSAGKLRGWKGSWVTEGRMR